MSLINTRPVLLVNSGGEETIEEWRELFNNVAPHLDVRWIDDPTISPGAVSYVFVWSPRHGFLASLPNLRLIVSSGAGVDHITVDPTWPRHVGIVRMGGDETAQRMGEYVCLSALALLRDLPRIVAAQHVPQWDHFDVARTALETRVGIMGFGSLGIRAATMLRALGFQVAGWARSHKRISGVECFAGMEDLPDFLAGTDLLVNLLPDTPETKGIIGAEAIAQLPAGAGIVNAGRGPQLVIPHLISALDDGHLSGAILDVFTTEPLAVEEACWRHPKIIVTPHLASLASRPARARYVAEAISAFESGQTPPNLYDPTRGY